MTAIHLELKKYTRLGEIQASARKVIHYENEAVTLHDHDYFELVVVYKGEGQHLIDGITFPLYPNEVFLIFPGQQHSYVNHTHLSLLTFMFNMSILEPYMEMFNRIEGFRKVFAAKPSLKTLHFVDEMTTSQLDNLVFRITDEQMNMRPGFPAMLTILQLEALMLIARQCFDISNEEAMGSSKLAPAISHMEKNFQQKLTLKDLAQLVGMSIPNFCRLFRSRLNVSPIQYLLNLRIKKAKSRLAYSSLSIAEIAAQTGFNDANYFSRQFVRLVGVPPHVYRTRDHGLLHTPGQDLAEKMEFGDESRNRIKTVE